MAGVAVEVAVVHAFNAQHATSASKIAFPPLYAGAPLPWLHTRSQSQV